MTLAGVQGRHSGVQTLYLVEEQPNPSSDFFVLPAVSRASFHVVRCGFADLPSPSDLAGATVIFVRYVPSAWAKLIESVRPSLRALVFFMDDDVLDMAASAGMPLRYRFKLARLAAWRAGWLHRQGAELWVSTPYLMGKYAARDPKLLLPSPLAAAPEVRRVFYHGSASHDAEIRWLRPVMEEVLRRDERIAFEIVGGRDVYRMYRGLPRVTVVHPMKWPAYQSFLAMPGRHIGLAPLHDLAFNRGRSYTKFFDITRCGAVGIYTPDGVYSGVVGHGVEGLVVPLEQEAWVAAILELARNEPFRQGLLGNAEVKSKELGDLAQRNSTGLLK
jgi:hypothetical protein